MKYLIVDNRKNKIPDVRIGKKAAIDLINHRFCDCDKKDFSVFLLHQYQTIFRIPVFKKRSGKFYIK